MKDLEISFIPNFSIDFETMIFGAAKDTPMNVVITF